MRLALAAGLCLAAAAAQAAPPGARDPDWPCQQIKVAQLSIGAYWTGPAIDTSANDWSKDPQIAALVPRLTQRRLPMQQAETEIADFARQAGAQKQEKLLGLMAGLFSALNQERGSVIAGLDRFGHRQKELATGIRGDVDKLHELQGAKPADEAAVKQMAEKIDWETRMFQDRHQAINYACDVPNKIEQRLFALARAIQSHLG